MSAGSPTARPRTATTTLPRRIVHHVRRNAPLAIMDAVIVLTSYLVALVLRFSGQLPDSYYWRGYEKVVGVIVAIHLLSNWAFGLYGQMWAHASVMEARRVLLAGAASLIAILGLDIFLDLVTERHRNPMPLSVLILGCGLAVAGFGAVRFQSRLFAFRRREHDAPLEGRQVTRVLLMGVGDAGARVLRDITTDHSLEVVALIDDDPRKLGLSLNGVTVMGPRSSVPELAKTLEAEQLLLTIPSANSNLLQDVARLCETAELSMRVLPTLNELVADQVSARDLRAPRIEDLLGRRQIALDLGAVSSFLHDRRVLITGAGGSIGSEIAKQVETFRPSALILLDNDETHLYDLCATLSGRVTSVLADVRDRPRVLEAFAAHAPEVVFHAAAHKHVPILETHPQEALATNVFGTANVVDASLASGVDRFVLISTDKAVRPVSVMGGSKRFAEDMVRSQQERGTVMSVVRFGNVLGSRGSVVPTFMRQIRAGGPVTVTDPDMTRYFMSLHEAVELVLQAAAIARGGEVFTLDMGEPVNILQLARRMIRLAGRVPYRDVPIVVTGRRPGEKLHEELIDPEEEQFPSGHPGIDLARPAPPDAASLRRRAFEMQTLAREGRLDELAQSLRKPVGQSVVRAVTDDLVVFP